MPIPTTNLLKDITMDNTIIVKQVKKFPIFDVFQGEGWENWSRILLKANKAVLIGGQPLTIGTLKAVVKQIKTAFEETKHAT